MFEPAPIFAQLAHPTKNVCGLVPAPVRATIAHVVNLGHHVMANLVPRIRVISKVGRDETHKFFVIRVRLVG